MRKTYLIRLEESNLGQIIEGLQARDESWCKTANDCRSGCNPDDAFVIKECNDQDEAEQIAQLYLHIIRDLARQRDEQRRAGSLA